MAGPPSVAPGSTAHIEYNQINAGRRGSLRVRRGGRRGRPGALYDERFCRIREFYLAGAEAAFRAGGQMIFQPQLAKRIDAAPLTATT
jgi:hypothetical protein